MNILVNEIEESEPQPQTECIIKAKNTICPECKEDIKLDFEDYKIILSGCKNNHCTGNLYLDEFEPTQKIDLSRIICEKCKIYNQGNVHNNIFYICNNCKINLCPICYSAHDKNHNVINYNDKNHFCEEHNKIYISYCKKCKKIYACFAKKIIIIMIK